MRSALIVYASTYGQTEKIAGYMAGRLRAQGVEARAIHARAADAPGQLADIDVIFLGGSLYVRRFQSELDVFIHRHREALNAHPGAVFFSVSASAANAAGREAVDTLVSDYLEMLDWQPGDRANFAGAVKYPRYGRLTRWMMRRISRKEGGGVDTRCEYEYTDWDAVDALLDRHLRR